MTKLRYFLAVLALVALFAWPGSRDALHERKLYWGMTLAHEIPPGTPRNDVIAWGKARNLTFDLDHYTHSLVARAESIEEPGLAFPCSEWIILLHVDVDANGRSTATNVLTAGKCM